MDTLLNVLLAAGVFGVILNAIITGYRERNARKREMHAREREMQGLLRMLYVEIERNRGESELLLSAPNNSQAQVQRQAEWWADHVYEDDTWKEVRSRLSQLFPDEDNFNRLVAYYARNNVHEKGILKVIERGASLSAPNVPFAKQMAEKTREQMDLAVDILDMIQGYIGNPPVSRESVEDAKQEAERHQRELDAEKG